MISRINERESLFQSGGFLTGKLQWNHLLLPGPKTKRKWRKSFDIFMFIANNSILSRLCNTFLAKSIALKECYLMMNFDKKIILQFVKDPQKCKFDGQT